MARWMLLDEAGNAIAAYDDEASAHAEMRVIADEEPDAAEGLLLLMYDDEGNAVPPATTFQDLPDTTVSLTEVPRELVVFISRQTVGFSATLTVDNAIARPVNVGTSGSSALSPV